MLRRWYFTVFSEIPSSRRSPCCAVPPSPAEGPPARARSAVRVAGRRLAASRARPGAMIRAAVAGVMAASPRATASIIARNCGRLEVLEEVPARSGPDGREQVLLVLADGQHDDRRLGLGRGDLPVASTPDIPASGRPSGRGRASSRSPGRRLRGPRPRADDLVAPRPQQRRRPRHGTGRGRRPARSASQPHPGTWLPGLPRPARRRLHRRTPFQSACRSSGQWHVQCDERAAPRAVRISTRRRCRRSLAHGRNP